ncbi:MAG: hypothetical protein IT318_07145 [Anaerolineales bacterium]|nr:hypothetical protein [Anaerolineales bacterium]
MQAAPLDDGVGLRLAQPVVAATGLSKTIEPRLEPGGVRVTHALRNQGLWPVELAPWALSAMAPVGVAILSLPAARLVSLSSRCRPRPRRCGPGWSASDDYE